MLQQAISHQPQIQNIAELSNCQSQCQRWYTNLARRSAGHWRNLFLSV